MDARSFVVCRSVVVWCGGNSYSNSFFVRSYQFKCFDRMSAILAVKFCVSRPCNYCNNLCSKLASFVIILVKNEINALKLPA